MVGQAMTQKVLNNTLLYIAKLFNTYYLQDWFICYGTLLGIVRENNCIDNDDDVDIVINKNYYNIVKKLLIDDGFELEYGYGINNSENIIKTKIKPGFSSIDIYMGSFDNGNCKDLWNNLLITNCYIDKNQRDYIIKSWNGVLLNLPNDYITKLVNRYGENWKTPINRKIAQTMQIL